MSVNSGAGAALFSGADYQARIAAYLLVSAICDHQSILNESSDISCISFETSESIDDINIEYKDGHQAYIQAKAKIDYGIKKESEFLSVLRQFVEQSVRSDANYDKYYLVTSSRSSKKVTFDLKNCLNAFRSGNPDRFENDQPKALVQIAEELRSSFQKLALERNITLSKNQASTLLKKCYVIVLDIDKADPIEQATLLLLKVNNFRFPDLIWGTIVSDCINHSKRRHTIEVINEITNYSRFKSISASQNDEPFNDMLRIELGKLQISSKKEVFLCDPETNILPKKLFVIEIVRFENNCSERAQIEDGFVTLPNGTKFRLLYRTSTFVGMIRLLDSTKIIDQDIELIFVPLPEDIIITGTACAEASNQRSQISLQNNNTPLKCLHCEKPISTNASNLIEQYVEKSIFVGLSHLECLEPEDRVIGTMEGEFFREYPELINFDANSWFDAAQVGQIAFRNVSSVKKRSAVLVWGGERRVRGQVGDWVIEVLLEGARREFVTACNKLEKYPKNEAEELAENFNLRVQEMKDSDPFCYSEQSKSSGAKSVLLEQLGGSERLFKVESFRARTYDRKFADRYQPFGNWYAPVMLLVNVIDGKFFKILENVVILTNPLNLKIHLENWKQFGIEIEKYEVFTIVTDEEFDKTLYNFQQSDNIAIVDPILSAFNKIASGTPLMPLKVFQDRIKKGLIGPEQILN